jgi:hypothetical protein
LVRHREGVARRGRRGLPRRALIPCPEWAGGTTAAHLVNRVIPQVPVRQWVLSLPRWARFLLARDPMLITRSLDIALRTIFAHQRRRARRAGALAPRTGVAPPRRVLVAEDGMRERPEATEPRLSVLWP